MTRMEIGQRPPPPEGYSIERFEGYIDEMEKRVAQMEVGTDRRGVFEITYLIFSQQVLSALKARRFEDMSWATDMACRFIEVYRDQLALREQRHPSLCRAWRMAFDAMEEGRINVLQAMFLGVNAHINYDLAFVTLGSCRHAGDLDALGSKRNAAELALSLSRTGVPEVRYRDFLVINQLEWEAIALIQDAVLRDYNRMLYWGNRLTLRKTRFMGQRILMEARDNAWFQTTLLVHAQDAEERALVGRLIDAQAASLGDLVSSFTWRLDRMLENGISWLRRGERLDPELQMGLVEMAQRNAVVAELILRELAFGGADPITVLLALIGRGEDRLAGLFGEMVIGRAPRRQKRQLLRFLRGGSGDAAAIVAAMFRAGFSPKKLPTAGAVESVRRRWNLLLSDDVACLEVPEIQSIPTLRAALSDHIRQVRSHLNELGGGDRLPTASRRLDREGAASILTNHPDSWVRACTHALLAPGSVDSARNGETMSSVIERVLFLKETQVFMEVDISVLVHVANRLETRAYDTGKTIVRNAENTGGLYLIEEGDVAVTQRRDGREVEIARLSVHDSVGELSVLNDTPATADCTALGPVKCWFLPSGVLAELLHQYPRLSIGLIRMLSQRLVSTTLLVGEGTGGRGRSTMST